MFSLALATRHSARRRTALPGPCMETVNKNLDREIKRQLAESEKGTVVARFTLATTCPHRRR